MTKTPITEKAERECRSIDEVFDRMRSLETAAQGLRDHIENTPCWTDAALIEKKKACRAFDALKEGK